VAETQQKVTKKEKKVTRAMRKRKAMMAASQELLGERNDGKRMQLFLV
jgi:hypothetical protein